MIHSTLAPATCSAADIAHQLQKFFSYSFLKSPQIYANFTNRHIHIIHIKYSYMVSNLVNMWSDNHETKSSWYLCKLLVSTWQQPMPSSFYIITWDAQPNYFNMVKHVQRSLISI